MIFNPAHTRLKMLVKMKHTPVYIQALQSLSSDIKNTKPNEEEVKKAIKS